MDIQALFNAISSAGRQSRQNYHVTLGKLIAALEVTNGTLPVKFDCGGAPSDAHSYRGYYEDLAFDPSGERVLAHGLLETCRAALGATFQGYKGGDFTMKEDTPLWAASWGNCGRAIIDLKVTDSAVTLVTKEID